MQLTVAQAIPFSRAARLARTVGVQPVAIGRAGIAHGVPFAPGGVDLSKLAPVANQKFRLGNMPAALADYINTPGTPGSSTFYLYGLGQDDTSSTDATAEDIYGGGPATADVTTSTSPSFMTAIQSVLTSAAETAKAVVPAVLQFKSLQDAQAALAAGKITQAQYNQIASQPIATVSVAPSSAALRTAQIGGVGVLALGAGALALLFLMRKK